MYSKTFATLCLIGAAQAGGPNDCTNTMSDLVSDLSSCRQDLEDAFDASVSLIEGIRMESSSALDFLTYKATLANEFAQSDEFANIDDSAYSWSVDGGESDCNSDAGYIKTLVRDNQSCLERVRFLEAFNSWLDDKLYPTRCGQAFIQGAEGNGLNSSILGYVFFSQKKG